MNPLVVVAGATGDLGSRIATALRRRGTNVRALVRPETDPAKVDSLSPQGVEVRRVDFADLPTLTQACAGADRAVSVLGIGSHVSFSYLQMSLPYIAGNVEVVGILDSGHYMFEEKPAQVLDAVLRFLQPAD